MADQNSSAENLEAAARYRGSVRRGVSLRCEVRSDLWDGAVRFDASNLSPEGLWLETHVPLEEGEELLVSFSPPGQFLRLHALCEVRRVGLWRRAEDLWPSGMGIVFTDLTRADRDRLARALIGIPPPLPIRGVRRRRRLRRALAGSTASSRDRQAVLPAVLDPGGCDPDVEELRWSAMAEPLTGGLPRRTMRG